MGKGIKIGLLPKKFDKVARAPAFKSLFFSKNAHIFVLSDFYAKMV